MGLWDALSGRILHFNTMKTQANDLVCKGLKRFLESETKRYPEQHERFREATVGLYAYYSAASTVISKELGGFLEPHKNQFFAMNPQSFLRFISGYHSSFILNVYKGNPSACYMLITGVCDMYGRPDSFATGWYEIMEVMKADDDAGNRRAMFRVYDEIAVLVGLPESNPFKAAEWMWLREPFGQVARRLFDTPGWANAVESEMALH